jgi:transposase
MGQVTLILGRERRRHWSAEDRARILAAISAPGAVVAEVARREDICTSLVYKWRRQTRRAAKGVEFAPVVIEPAPPARPGSASEPRDIERSDAAGVITVEMTEVCVRIGAGASAALVSATLKALRS